MESFFHSQLVRALACGCVAAFLYGCGGGGGGDSTSSTPTTPPPLTVTPTTVSVTTTQSVAVSFDVTLSVNTQVVTDLQNAYVLITSSDAWLSSAFDVNVNSLTSAVLTFHTQKIANVGNYTGQVQFFICRDENCTNKYSNTPATVNYSVKVDPAPPVAVLTPSSINVSVEAGEPLLVTLEAQTSPTLSGFSAAMSDAQGRFASLFGYIPVSLNRYSLQLNILPIYSTGTYSGVVYIFICEAAPCSSASQASGSPIMVPYTITVTPAVLLQAVPTVTGLPEWETHQGSASHTGYVPVALDSSQFSQKWNWLTNTYGLFSELATGSGKAFISASLSSQSGSGTRLFAFNESDGTIAWQQDFGSFDASAPAVSAGRVFLTLVATNAINGVYGSLLWSSDLDGNYKFQSSFKSATRGSVLAPVFSNGYVYSRGAEGGGMSAFKARTGTLQWSSPLTDYSMWSPAVDSNYAYTLSEDNLVALDIATGSRAFAVSNSVYPSSGNELNMAPVLPGDGSVILVDGVGDSGYAYDNHLIRYSISSRNELWRVSGKFTSDPAVASGKIYVLNATGNALEARDETTGALLWSWAPSAIGEYVSFRNIVVTDNLLFLATNVATYAIDLSTHQTVWSAAYAGNLAISSNKVLYINTRDGRIVAYGLSN